MRQVCLTVAVTDPDAGTRITAVRALLELGFDDAPVEAAAKESIREFLRTCGSIDGEDEPSTLKRWIEQVKQSSLT